MDVPKFTVTQYSYQLKQHSNCRKFVNMKHTILYHSNITYKAKEQQHQKEISQLLELDLPAIMSKFNNSRVDPQPHGRHKDLSVNLLEFCLIE